MNYVEVTAFGDRSPMIDIANIKAAGAGLGGDISFIYGAAAHLPFPAGYFDCVGISVAFRNLTYKNPLVQRYLAEVLRVLRVNGRFVIVETSQPELKLMRKLYHLYLRWFAFGLGYLISGNRGAYHYLAESAARFYTPAELTELLLTAGFRQVSSRPIFMGAISTHLAVK